MNQLLFILSLSYLWFSFRELWSEMSKVYEDTKSLVEVAKAWFFGAISCGKCLSFYVGLFVSHNIVIACAASVIYDLYARIKLKLL